MTSTRLYLRPLGCAGARMPGRRVAAGSAGRSADSTSPSPQSRSSSAMPTAMPAAARTSRSRRLERSGGRSPPWRRICARRARPCAGLAIGPPPDHGNHQCHAGQLLRWRQPCRRRRRRRARPAARGRGRAILDVGGEFDPARFRRRFRSTRSAGASCRWSQRWQRPATAFRSISRKAAIIARGGRGRRAHAQ